MNVKSNPVDLHRFHAYPNLDPTLHFDANPETDWDPTPRFTHLAKSEHFYLYHQRRRRPNFLNVGQNIEIFWKKVLFSSTRS